MHYFYHLIYCCNLHVYVQGHNSLEAKESNKQCQSQIYDYAVRFLEYNSRTNDFHVLPEAPPTPDRLNDFGILKVSDHLSEVNHLNILCFIIDFLNFHHLP